MATSRFFKVTNDKTVSVVRVDDEVVEKKSKKWFGSKKPEYEVRRSQEVVASREATDHEKVQPKIRKDEFGRKINCEEIDAKSVIQRKF